MTSNDRGSAHSGMKVWWWQRVTGFYIALFTVISIVILRGLDGNDYDMALSFLSSPPGKALSIGFTISVILHAYIGLRTIIEDYVPSGSIRTPFIAILNLLIAVIGLWAIIVILSLSGSGTGPHIQLLSFLQLI